MSNAVKIRIVQDVTVEYPDKMLEKDLLGYVATAIEHGFSDEIIRSDVIVTNGSLSVTVSERKEWIKAKV